MAKDTRRVTTTLEGMPTVEHDYDIVDNPIVSKRDTHPYAIIETFPISDVTERMDTMSTEELKSAAREAVTITMAGERRAELRKELGFVTTRRGNNVSKSSVGVSLREKLDSGLITQEQYDELVASIIGNK